MNNENHLAFRDGQGNCFYEGDSVEADLALHIKGKIVFLAELGRYVVKAEDDYYNIHDLRSMKKVETEEVYKIYYSSGNQQFCIGKGNGDDTLYWNANNKAWQTNASSCWNFFIRCMTGLNLQGKKVEVS